MFFGREKSVMASLNIDLQPSPSLLAKAGLYLCSAREPMLMGCTNA
jgi:hypothetical protein